VTPRYGTPRYGSSRHRTSPYELGTAPPARRALATTLPPDVADAAVELITGALLDDPRRLGTPLGAELEGIFSARVGRDFRVLYEIDGRRRVVIVLDIRSRSTAHRGR
jgi:mRNA-degrading endonuclease RelE of RelBE toxin-antitoxin system